MTQSGLRSKLLSSEIQQDEKVVEMAATAKVFQGSGPALRNWKISTTPEEQAVAVKIEGFDFGEEELARIKSAHKDQFQIEMPAWLQVVQYAAVFATVAWLTFSAIYISSLPQGFAQIFASPLSFGSIFAAILAPVALIWLCVATWQRRMDAHLYAEALRRELQRLLFPTPDQARVVNRDIQLLVQQAVEISTSSRAALKAIQRARQGLRSEIRDFSGVSQKTEFHIDRLAETLTKRAEELLKLTDQIEKRSKNISEEVKSGVEVWTEVSQEALSKVDEIQSSFDKRTQSFEDQTKKLADASVRLSGETSKLENGFEDRFTRLENLSVQGIESFHKITTGLEKIDEIAEGLFSRSEVVEANLAKQSESIKQATADLSTRVNDLDLIGTSAAHKLGEALAMALSGSDSIVSAVRRAREQLERAATETSGKAEELLEETDKRIENLSVNAAERLGKIQTMMGDFDDRQKSIADVLDKLSEQNENVTVVTDQALDRLTSAVHLLDQSAQTIDIKSAKPVTEIREATEHLAGQIAKIHENLRSGVADLDLNTEKAKTAADEIARSLKEHNQDIVHLSGQVATNAKTLNAHFDGQKENISSFIEETDEKIQSLNERLDTQLAKFTSTVDEVEAEIGTLGGHLEEKGRKAVDDAASYTDELKNLESSVVEQLENLSSKTSATKETIETLEANIRNSAEATLPVYEKIIAGVEDADNRFDRLRDSAEASTNDIFERMEALSRELEEQISKLNEEVETSERSLTSLTGDIRGSVTHIGDAADQAAEKLRHLHANLQGRTEDLQLLSEQTELKVDHLQKTLDANTSEMRNSLSKATEKLEEAADEFSKASVTIDEKADASAKKISHSANMFIEEGHRLAMSGEQTLHKASRISSEIQGETETLLDKSKESLTELAKTSDSLSIRVREIEAYTKAAISSTQNYNDSLKDQVRVISDTSSEAADKISDSLSKLSAKGEETVRQGEKVVENVERARLNLSKETERLETSARKATELSEEAAGRFIRHSSSILKSADDISNHAERIRDLQIRSSREAFLSSAKFIIESLHSLAVDVSRHLEDDVDERSWRAYQKGDVAVFTRRLVQIADTVPMDRVRRKFVEDGEFRNYTQRYLRQFEELFESAQSNDHGELLSSIFVSSDVGKLYRLLCDISGRAAKIN